MSYMICPTCGEANGMVNTTLFQCACARKSAAPPPSAAERKFTHTGFKGSEMTDRIEISAPAPATSAAEPRMSAGDIPDDEPYSFSTTPPEPGTYGDDGGVPPQHLTAPTAPAKVSSEAGSKSARDYALEIAIEIGSAELGDPRSMADIVEPIIQSALDQAVAGALEEAAQYAQNWEDSLDETSCITKRSFASKELRRDRSIDGCPNGIRSLIPEPAQLAAQRREKLREFEIRMDEHKRTCLHCRCCKYCEFDCKRRIELSAQQHSELGGQK